MYNNYYMKKKTENGMYVFFLKKNVVQSSHNIFYYVFVNYSYKSRDRTF